jgi:ParB-like chromosome segregation protein Spo0J
MTAQNHAARVAWLIKFADLEKVTITIAENKVVDGNHRLSACIYSKIEVIKCVVMPTNSKISMIAA